MKQKITLIISENLIKSAEQVAEEQEVSLSFLIENYLRLLTTERTKKIKNEDLSPRVKKLRGITEVHPDFDVRKEYTNYLIKKYA